MCQLKNIEFKVMHKQKEVCHIIIYAKTNSVKVKRGKLPYPIYPFKGKVTKKKVFDFLKDRCFPDTRENTDEILKELGLKSYVPLEICKKTHGLLFDDYTWLKFPEDGEIEYDDIRIRWEEKWILTDY